MGKSVIIKRKPSAPPFIKKKQIVPIMKKKPISKPNIGFLLKKKQDSPMKKHMAPLIKKKQPAPLINDDDMSASDSLVAIREQERARARAEDARRKAPAATDQVSRLRAAHAQATNAALAAADASESTQDRVANEARRAAAPNAPAFRASGVSSSSAAIASKESVKTQNDSTPSLNERLRAMAPPVDGLAVDVFRGSTGVAPPLALQENYRLLHRQVNESMRITGDAPTGNQMGMRIADVASQLVRESNETALTGQLPRVLSSTVSPLMDTFCRMLVERTINEASIPPHLNDPQSEALHRIRQAVRVSPRAHEERMLRLPLPGEPPCSMGDRCVGNLIQCQMGGGTLVAFYYEDEWAKYKDEQQRSQVTARLPKQHRLCLLCIRYDTNRCITSLRCDDMQLAMETVRNDQQAMPVILQPHFNLVDVEGEYPSEYCLTPVLEAYEGLPYPTVKPSLLYFTRAVDTNTGIVYFRQKIPYPKISSAQSSSAQSSSSSAAAAAQNSTKSF